MNQQIDIFLDYIEVRKHDLVNFHLVYFLAVDYKYCSWTLTKFKTDFVTLNQSLPAKCRWKMTKLFPIWAIRPSETRLAEHHKVVEEYLKHVQQVDEYKLFLEFCELPKHDVISITVDLLKDCRQNLDSSAQSWELLNQCEEVLLLTEKQLHSVNSCNSALQIPFIELRTTLENIEHVKIVGQSDETHRYKPTPNLDMSQFSSVICLILKDVDFKGVSEFGGLSETLQELTVTAEITEIKEVLLWVEERGEKTGPVSWHYLQKLDLSHNFIEQMDESLQMLISLRTLNLSHNKILTIDNIQGLPYLHKMDLSYNKIIEIENLHLKIGNMTSLDLSHNVIKKITGLEKLYSIETLNLSYNCIDQSNEVSRLSRLPQLRYLYLHDNPLQSENKQTYRIRVLPLFDTSDNFRLDGVSVSVAEHKTLGRIKYQQVKLDAYQEESVCIVEIGNIPEYDFENDHSIADDSLAITFSDVNLVETRPAANVASKKVKASIEEMVVVDEVDGEPDVDFVRDRTFTILEVPDLITYEGDDWIASFMDEMPDKPKSLDLFECKFTVVISKEKLKALDPVSKMKRDDELSSRTTESSSHSQTSKKSAGTTEDNTIKPSYIKPDAYCIVPNEVYNIDENIDDLIVKHSTLAFSQLKSSYSVYRDGKLYVLGLDPFGAPHNPELIEVTPKGGVVSWSLFCDDIEGYELVGDNVKIKKEGDDIPRVYSQIFLRDVAHLYLLLKAMTSMAHDKTLQSEEHVKPASERVFLHVTEGETTESVYAFPTHCFRYNKADCPIPVVVAVTETEIFIIEIQNIDVLNLNEDTLSNILSETNEYSATIILRKSIRNVKQIYKSYFQHTVRMEFKEDLHPFGNPQSTFSFLGFNPRDIEMFLEKVSCKLDNESSEVIVSEDELELKKFQVILRIRDVQQIKCLTIRQIDEPHYFHCLVLTENYLFILEEDFVRWPPPCFVRHPPTTPRYIILQKTHIRHIFGVTLYNNLYHGGYALMLDYRADEKKFLNAKWELLIPSFDNREQIEGHIKRTWRQYYKMDIIISHLDTFRKKSLPSKNDEKHNVGTSDISTWTLDNLCNAPMEKLQQFMDKILQDSYTMLYHTTTHCIYSKNPEQEYKCKLIITSENLHVVVSHVIEPPNTEIPETQNGGTFQPNDISEHLTVLFSHSVTDILQIVSGLFEQKIRFEFLFDIGLIAFMTRNVSKTAEIKAAVMCALHCDYELSCDSDDYHTIRITRRGRELSLVSPDDDRLDELRYAIAEFADIHDYNEIQILNYYLCYRPTETCCSMITVVITYQSVFLIEEDHIHWPLPQSLDHTMPSSVQFQIKESVAINDIVCIQYSHIISGDFTIVYEDVNDKIDNDDCIMINSLEKMGKTVKLLASSYRQRDRMIRMLTNIKADDLPVKKIE